MSFDGMQHLRTISVMAIFCFDSGCLLIDCAGLFLATLALVEMERRRGSGKGRDEEKKEEENGRERGGRRGKGGEGNRAREKERVPTTKKIACNLAMGEHACKKMRGDACSLSSADDKQDCIESCNQLQDCMRSWMSLIANFRSTGRLHAVFFCRLLVR